MNAAADWTPDDDEIAVPVDAATDDDMLLDLGYEAAMPGLQGLFMMESPPPIR